MNVQVVTHFLFVLAWALLALEVIRSLIRLAGMSRPIAGATAAGVAIAYFLGATGPLAWGTGGGQENAGPPVVNNVPAPPAAPPPIASCPRNAVVSTHSGLGYIDIVGIGTAPPAPKPAKLEVPAGTDVHLSGWATLKTGPGTTICAIDNGHTIPGLGSYGGARPDVAAATGNPANSATGYSLTIKPSKGTHVLTVGAVEADGHSIDKISGGTVIVNVH